MYAQNEYRSFIQRAQQHLINNNAQRINNQANAKFRYETQQRVPLKPRPNRERVQNAERQIQPKKLIKNVSIEYESKSIFRTRL